MAIVRTAVGVVLQDGDPPFERVYVQHETADSKAIQPHRGRSRVARLASWKAALVATPADDLPTAFLAKLTVGDLRRTWKRLAATIRTQPYATGIEHLVKEFGEDEYEGKLWMSAPLRLLVASAVDRWLRDVFRICPGFPGTETLPADDLAWLVRPTAFTDARVFPRYTASSDMALHAVIAGMHRVATGDARTPLCVDEHCNHMLVVEQQLRLPAMPMMDVGSPSPGCTHVDPVVALFTVKDTQLLRKIGSGETDVVCRMLGVLETDLVSILRRTGIGELTSVHEVRNVGEIFDGANPVSDTARRVLWTSIPADNTLLRVRGEAHERTDSVLTLIQRALTAWGTNVTKRHDRQVVGKKFSVRVPHTQLAAGCSASSFAEDHTLHDLALGPVAVYMKAMFGGLLHKGWDGKWVLAELPATDAALKTDMAAALATANAWFDQQHVAADLRHKGRGGDRKSREAKRRRTEKPATLPADPDDPEGLEMLAETPSRRENLRQWRKAAEWLKADQEREFLPMAYPPFDYSDALLPMQPGAAEPPMLVPASPPGPDAV